MSVSINQGSISQKVAVLGAGLVGGPMAADLCLDERFEVTAVDRDLSALDKLHAVCDNLHILQRDLSNPDDLTSLVSDFDLVLCAVPGFMGFETLKTIIKAGKNVVDISFFAQDPFDLDELAHQRGVVSVVDCGIAPGMSNIITGYVDSKLDKTDRVLIYVGGLPKRREWPFEYQAVFSPIDVIEEYTRPARYKENGRLVTRPALTDPELLHFSPIGTLEAFNSDGLRTLLHSIDAPDLKEKTLRYMGHREKMAVFRETGFFDEQEIEIRGVKIRPIDLTQKLLFPKWQMKEGDRDITVMRVIIEGQKDGANQRHTFDLYDRYDTKKRVHSMARTTGYTATAVLRLLSEGLYRQVGISPPEYLGRHEACFDYVINCLSQREIVFRKTVEEIT